MGSPHGRPARPRAGGAHLQPRPICGGGTNTQVSAPPDAALMVATCCEKLVASASTCARKRLSGLG